MKKALWFILLFLAVVGLIGSIGYLALYGKWVILACEVCLGVLATFKAIEIVKDIFKVEPKPDTFVQEHSSTPRKK